MFSLSSRSPSRLVFRYVLRALLIAWAGFWAWFVLAVSYGGAEAPPPLWIPIVWLSALSALVLLGWKLPTAGGIALVTTGLASAAFFSHPAARALLAGPAVLLGLGCLAMGWRDFLEKRAPPARHRTE